MKILSIISATMRDLLSFVWPLSHRGNLIRAVLLLGLVGGAGYALTRGNDAVVEDAPEPLPLVELVTASEVGNGDVANYIGAVRSVAEAEIQSEVGGRITSVRFAAGDRVSAGAIIATIENASQQAAVLQARGAYEAALAAAAQSEVGAESAATQLTAAQNAAVNAYRNAFSAAQSTVLGTIDPFFSSPLGPVPGVRIGSSQTSFLNNERVELQQSLPAWQARSTSLDTGDDLTAALTDAERETQELIALLDVLIADTADAGPQETLLGLPVASYTSGLVSARATLTGNVQALRAAKTGIASAEEGVRQAAISGTGNSEVSAAQAQVTQALGALRAAQANLEKTILRSPIAGTLEVLRVNEGQFVQAFTPVGLVTSAGGLEVSIFIGERERDQFTVGEEVRIDEVATGTVVNVAPAIDPVTQKIEVKVATDAPNLINGQTVRITKPTSADTAVQDAPILVPITALKFTNEAPAMFTVVDGVLVSLPVTIGDVSGSYVTIESGIDAATEFVRDVRGKNAGQAVSVSQN